MDNIAHLVDRQPLLKDLLIRIGKIAAEYKKDVYPVGGVVRDLIEDRKIKEVDLMVIGDGIDFAKILADKLGASKIVPFHRFSTAHIPLRPIPNEVAAAREETISV